MVRLMDGEDHTTRAGIIGLQDLAAASA